MGGDVGSWCVLVERYLDMTGDVTLVSLPLGHKASARSLAREAGPRARKKLSGPLAGVRAARMTERVGALDRTLVVVESPDEAGDTLCTFLRLPNARWKASRNPNALERLNGEFRAPTDAQASLPRPDPVLLLTM